MVSRLRSISVDVSFQDRTYHVGEAIDVTIGLRPNRDCHVREARIDLLADLRWLERSTATIEKPNFASAAEGLCCRPVARRSQSGSTRAIGRPQS